MRIATGFRFFLPFILGRNEKRGEKRKTPLQARFPSLVGPPRNFGGNSYPPAPPNPPYRNPPHLDPPQRAPLNPNPKCLRQPLFCGAYQANTGVLYDLPRPGRFACCFRGRVQGCGIKVSVGKPGPDPLFLIKLAGALAGSTAKP